MHHLGAIGALYLEVVPCWADARECAFRLVLPGQSRRLASLTERLGDAWPQLLRNRNDLDVGVSASSRKPADLERDGDGSVGRVAVAQG